VKAPAVRSQLLRLREDLRAAADGRDLLDRKREAVLRSLAIATTNRTRLESQLRDELRTARTRLASAQTELGRAAVDAAALAQQPLPPVEIAESAIVGVRIPHLQLRNADVRPLYAPASGSPGLDDATLAWGRVLEPLLAFAAADVAVRRLKAALARSARRLNALDRELIPSLREELRELSASLEEEERDDAIRRRQWLARSSESRSRA